MYMYIRVLWNIPEVYMYKVINNTRTCSFTVCKYILSEPVYCEQSGARVTHANTFISYMSHCTCIYM